MSQHVVNAGVREIGTKGALASLRRNGNIPAVMYNRKGETVNLSLNAIDFDKSVTGATESTVIELKINNENHQCLIKDRQLDYLNGKIVHVDFFEVEAGVMLRAKVPVQLVGTPVGVRAGGILENPMHEVEVECLPKDMPPKFVIDVTNLAANHSIHVRDIEKSDAVKFVGSQEKVVAIVKFAKEEEVAAAPEAAAPAEGEAAAPAAAAPEAEKK